MKGDLALPDVSGLILAGGASTRMGRDKGLLAVTHALEAVPGQEVLSHVVVLEGAERVLTMLGTAGRDAGGDGHVLRDQAVVSQGGLQAHIRRLAQVIGHQKGMGSLGLVRWCNRIDASAKLQEPA